MGDLMLTLHIEIVGDVVVIECEGTIEGSDAAIKLREAVTAYRSARVIVLEFSAVPTIEEGVLSMLVFLQRWALSHEIRLKLFNLSPSVRAQVKGVHSMREFDIASLDEMMALIAQAGLMNRAA
jgi:anti-anti-sigma regulatory factor